MRWDKREREKKTTNQDKSERRWFLFGGSEISFRGKKNTFLCFKYNVTHFQGTFPKGSNFNWGHPFKSSHSHADFLVFFSTHPVLTPASLNGLFSFSSPCPPPPSPLAALSDDLNFIFLFFCVCVCLCWMRRSEARTWNGKKGVGGCNKGGHVFYWCTCQISRCRSTVESRRKKFVRQLQTVSYIDIFLVLMLRKNPSWNHRKQ